jgi:hypothetical protein
LWYPNLQVYFNQSFFSIFHLTYKIFKAISQLLAAATIQNKQRNTDIMREIKEETSPSSSTAQPSTATSNSSKWTEHKTEDGRIYY